MSVFRDRFFFRLIFSKNRNLAGKLLPILGFVPKHIDLFEIAFIHKSASVILPNGEMVNNERLEFLGDAVLDLIAADYLFRRFPEKDEGFLTKMRSKMVKRKHLNLLAYHIGIPDLIVSQSMDISSSKHVLGNAFEALVGAVYLDSGYKNTYSFIERTIDQNVNIDKLRKSETDYKSKLMEYSQKKKFEIEFVTMEEMNPHTRQLHFTSIIMIANKNMGKGIANSKKDAEQKASKMTLELLRNK